jgi:hypothetical protein
LNVDYQPDKQSLLVSIEKTADTLKNIHFTVKDEESGRLTTQKNAYPVN